MKFFIEKRDLSSITTLVHRAASNKNTIPILSGLMIDLSQSEGLTMTATDMEIGIKASTNNVDIAEEGKVLVNANYFADFIKLLPDTLIEIELDKEKAKLKISYGRSTGYINIYLEEEYPDLPIDKMEYRYSIPQKVLKEALKKTVFATALNHFRQVFTGVLFDITENSQLKIVASDTHRLAHYSYMLEEENLEPFNYVIPVRTVNELLRVLEDTDESIKIAISNNNVIFYKDSFILLSRLIEGQYPNYDQVIPKSFTTSINVKTQILATSLERAKIVPTDDKFQIQHVLFTLEQGEAHLNTYSESMGEIVEIIEDISINGDESLKIAFNTNYFLDVVKILNQECDSLKIQLSGSLGPAMITNSDKDNYLYVLVPLRTNN